MDDVDLNCRYFTSYSGVELPLKLVNELEPSGLENRITYFVGHFDDNDRLQAVDKVVYGEIEFSHHYEYADSGRLIRVTVSDEDESRTLMFDEQGKPTESGADAG